jgi:hypothetical protein
MAKEKRRWKGLAKYIRQYTDKDAEDLIRHTAELTIFCQVSGNLNIVPRESVNEHAGDGFARAAHSRIWHHKNFYRAIHRNNCPTAVGAEHTLTLTFKNLQTREVYEEEIIDSDGRQNSA